MVDAASNGSSRICNSNAGPSAQPVEEDSGVSKSGQVLASYGKYTKKSFYAVLSERALELHESEKTYRKKKNAKFLVDLSNCFNVAQHHDPKLKRCISVMSPDDTFLISGETDKQTDEWFDAVLSAAIPARALYLGRPVFPNEFFECAWDVNIVANPKLKKPVPNPENFPNIGIKKPEWVGRQRLCFYPHTIILCKMKIGPAMHGYPKSGIPPFKLVDFIELQRQFIANFGFQEKYFFMRIGRSSPTGSCEIWAQCDSEEIAYDVHTKLNEIIEREAEKKKKGLLSLGGKLNTTTERRHTPHHSRHGSIDQSYEPSTSSMNTSLNDSASTSTMQPPVAQKKSILKTAANADASKTELGPTPHARASTTPMSAREKRSILRELKARVDSFDEEQRTTSRYYEQQQAVVYGAPINKNIEKTIENDINRVRRKCSMGTSTPNAKTLPHHHLINNSSPQKRANSVSGHDPASTLGGTSIINYLRKLPEEKYENDRLESISLNNAMNPLGEWARHRASLASGASAGEDETEDSGGTLRIDYDENRSIHSTNSSSHRRLIQAPIEHHTSSASLNNQKRKDSHSSFTTRANHRTQSEKAEIGLDTFHYDRESTGTTTDESSSMGDLTGLSPNSRKRLTTGATSCSENLSTTSSVSTCQSSAIDPHEDPAEYTLMETCSSGSASHLVVPCPQFDHHYNLDEARSYVSDSSDSCYSSMTTNGYLNAPRAHSFSSQILPRRLMPNNNMSGSNNRVSFAESLEDAANASDETSSRKSSGMRNKPSEPAQQQNQLMEDLRKRAFSVGSSWLVPFKFSYNNIARLRPSTSKSGSSSVINDSEIDESGSKQNVGGTINSASTSSRQPSISSFTSAGSTSAQRLNSSSSSTKRRNLHFDGDLMELNFPHGNHMTPTVIGGTIGTRNSRGSIASVESPASFIGNRQTRLGPESIIESSTARPTAKYSEDAYVVGEINRPMPGALHLHLNNALRKPFLEDEPSDFVLEEAKCFMSPTDRESVAVLTSSKDSISLRSQKTGTPSEANMDGVSGRSSRNSLNSKSSMNPRAQFSVVSPTSTNNFMPFPNQRKKNRHSSASDSRSESFLMSELKIKPKSSNASLRSLQRTEESNELQNEVERHERTWDEKADTVPLEADYVQLETPDKYLRQDEHFSHLSTIPEAQVVVGERS